MSSGKSSSPDASLKTLTTVTIGIPAYIIGLDKSKQYTAKELKAYGLISIHYCRYGFKSQVSV
jgi:hypothetical protein